MNTLLNNIPLTDSELQDLGGAAWEIYQGIAPDLGFMDEPGNPDTDPDLVLICFDASRLEYLDPELAELFSTAYQLVDDKKSLLLAISKKAFF